MRRVHGGSGLLSSVETYQPLFFDALLLLTLICVSDGFYSLHSLHLASTHAKVHVLFTYVSALFSSLSFFLDFYLEITYSCYRRRGGMFGVDGKKVLLMRATRSFTYLFTTHNGADCMCCVRSLNGCTTRR